MDYQESREYLAQAGKYGSVLGLDNMRELMKRLGNPQDALSFVHVAGTNGKGSVIAYLYTTLREAGYRVGRYISPTLYSYRERMEVQGKRISRAQFAVYLTQVARVSDEMQEEGLVHPTTFEMETAAAFLYFQRENCDLVLLEVGMGGSTDATNIIKTAKLAVLASISMDHTDFLGNTLGEIAQKKAGIIKPGCRAVTMMQKPEAMEVIRQRCADQKVPLIVADAATAETTQASITGQHFRYEGEDYEIGLGGNCQKENAVLAIRALEVLGELGYRLTREQIIRGLAHTRWDGRFTVLQKKPLFIVDGAHNPGAAQQMAKSIERYFAGRTIYYILGMFRDKDVDEVLRQTVRYAKRIYTIAAPDNPRALSAQELAQIVRKYHEDVQPAQEIAGAVDMALAQAGEDDVILAFGSLANIGELTRLIKQRGTEENA